MEQELPYLWNDPHHTYGGCLTSVSDRSDQAMGTPISCLHPLTPVSRAFDEGESNALPFCM